MSTHLTLFYDGNCPLCLRAMHSLRRADRQLALAFVDIAAPGFDPAPLGVTVTALNTEMHALRADGTLLRGTDSILAAHALVGRAWLVWPLRIALLRPALGAGYRWLARNRLGISRLLRLRQTARATACEGNACRIYFGDAHHGT
jgi:predicted DCC family thiol-disulfide oxidoreductase YuxK